LIQRLAGRYVVAALALLVAAVGGGLWLILRGIADQGDARESVTARVHAELDLDEALEEFARDPGDVGPAARAARLERIAAVDPSYAPAQRELGRWRLAAGDTARAEVDLRQALILDAFDAPSMILLGNIHLARHHDADALGWFEKALLYAHGDTAVAIAARAGVASVPAAR